MSLLLICPKTLGNGCSQFESRSLLSHISPIYHVFQHLKEINIEFKPQVHTHHDVIIITIVTIAMLTLCQSILSHATLILFYHTSMLTL